MANAAKILFVVASTAFAMACDTPHTLVVMENGYDASAVPPLVIYDAFWQAVRFETPIAPGSSSDPLTTVAASENTAYVVLAPGWDPQSTTPPTSLIVMESRAGFGVSFDSTLDIQVDDTTFMGNCASGSSLTQGEANFITQFVFPNDFASLSYDATSCTTTPISDAGTD
jgi:hypothetical protein